MSEAMKMELVLVFAAIFFAMPVVVNTNVNVVVAPPYEPVHFDCEARGDFLVWLVNTVALTDAVEEEREIVVNDKSSNGTQHSILTITALPINNGIDIGCIIGIAPYHVTFFDEKRLEVRGVSSVENITLNFTLNNSLFVSWSPPLYRSNDVSNEDLHYEVTVTNGNKSFTYPSIVHTNIEVPNVTACDTFNVSVKALVKQYSSIIAEENEGNYSIILIKNNCSTEQVLIQLDYAPSHCPSLLSINDESNNISVVTTQDTEFVIYTLLPFKHYELMVYVRNLRNEIQNELQINISTYHVQGLDLKSYSNGTVGVKCLYYCQHIASKGCQVIFKNTAQRIQKHFNITGLHEKLAPLTNGYYTVTVYDLVNGSAIGPVLEPTQVEVDSLSPSLTSSTYSSSPSVTTSASVKMDQNLSEVLIVGIISGSITIIVFLLVIAIPCTILIVKKYKTVSQTYRIN